MATAIVLTVAVVVGNTLLTGASTHVLAFARAFASGAVLASVADTVMPDAYRQGSPLVAFATAAGFLLTFLTS
jgi:ZIP family zinc transporter